MTVSEALAAVLALPALVPATEVLAHFQDVKFRCERSGAIVREDADAVQAALDARSSDAVAIDRDHDFMRTADLRLLLPARGSTACGIRTLSAKVVVRLLDPPGVVGGILLPEAHRGRPTRGVVVAFGPGREYPTTGRRIPPGVELGDVVAFTRGSDMPVFDDRIGKRAGRRWEVGGGHVVTDKLAVLSQEEILCVLDDVEYVESVDLGGVTYDVVPPLEVLVRYLPGSGDGEFDADVVTAFGEFGVVDADSSRDGAVSGARSQFAELIEGLLVTDKRHLSPSGEALARRLRDRVRERGPC